jgi:hypothetical protein
VVLPLRWDCKFKESVILKTRILTFLLGLLLQRDGSSTVLTGTKQLRMRRIGITRDKRGV